MIDHFSQKPWLTIALTLLLTACSGAAVKESSRDTSGVYDGVWEGTTTTTRSPQRFGDWIAQCTKPNANFKLLIKDGQISLLDGKKARYSYIDTKGRFRFTIPTEHRMSASLGSGSSLNSEIRVIVQGVLGSNQPAGKFIVGVAQFGWNGCTSSVAYTKI